MRTVTFSNREVAKALKDHFICTWVNREPGFHNCDNKSEQKIIEMESFATRNFCTFFTSPDLDVLHYASGFFRPDAFLGELKLVDRLRGAVLDLRNRYMEDALPEFRALHDEHADQHVADQAPRDESKGQRSPDRLSSEDHQRSEGLRYLAAVHKDLVGKATIAQGPIPLDSVWRTYLYGNGFQESNWKQRSPGDGPGIREQKSR